jgi:hypothetical protein
MGSVTPPPSGSGTGDPTDSGQDPTGTNPASSNPDSDGTTAPWFGNTNPALNAVYPTPASDATNSPSGSVADLISHDTTLNFGQSDAGNGNNGGAGAGDSGPGASETLPVDTSSEPTDGVPQHNFITGTVIDPWQVDGVHSDIPSVGHINSDWLLA